MEKALRRHLHGGDFNNVSEKRSKAMSAVRGKDNKTTERRLRSALAAAGIAGWKMHPRDVPGCPDFLFPEAGLAVFVDGCFWHGCRQCGHFPKMNSAFWKAKIERNRQRDGETNRRLRANGFHVLRFWEHELSQNVQRCIEKLRSTLQC